ncbi:hypothetical protein CLV65_0186 [Pseudoscardovia suis]|uniref:Uncharacterized protein n=1 Tax=Pseudoscardovia suis TaxID=987063 RepID=A0A261EYH4_9BIFI|nr:hypothetical protein PSSU_0702 [Pseudoscardovia suis]PJJ69483.1 hypothetical protein CLV65_0186 [Pseudoscardovia suis]
MHDPLGRDGGGSRMRLANNDDTLPLLQLHVCQQPMHKRSDSPCASAMTAPCVSAMTPIERIQLARGIQSTPSVQSRLSVQSMLSIQSTLSIQSIHRQPSPLVRSGTEANVKTATTSAPCRCSTSAHSRIVAPEVTMSSTRMTGERRSASRFTLTRPRMRTARSSRPDATTDLEETPCKSSTSA